MVAVLKEHIGLADHAQKMPSWGWPVHFPCFSRVWHLGLLTHMLFMFLQFGIESLSCPVTSCAYFTWQKGPQERRQWCSAARNSWALPQRSLLEGSHSLIAASCLSPSTRKPNQWSQKLSSLHPHCWSTKGLQQDGEPTSQTYFNWRVTILSSSFLSNFCFWAHIINNHPEF